MREHERFVWDQGKATQNVRKHGVSFEDVSIVLADDFFEVFHVEDFDVVGSAGADEDRWITTGSNPMNRSIVLRTVWTEQFDPAGQVTRIISSRR